MTAPLATTASGAPANGVNPPAAPPVVLERIDRFVARTQNWFYDHMRFVPRHRPVVVCGTLENRAEFPDLEAIHLNSERLDRRVWRKLGPPRLYPPDARMLKGYAPVAFHSHLGYVAVGDLPMVESLGVPWLVSFYGADVYLLGRNEKWRDRYAPLFARASWILSLGPAMSAGLEALGCPSGKIVIHPLGVDAVGLPHRPRVMQPGGPLKVLFSGTFREKKGGVYLIEALGRLRQRGVPLELHLVGDASGRPGDAETKAEMFRLVDSFGLREQTHHYAWLPFKDLIALALDCHVFVAPSVTAQDGDSEGSPAVMGQMMATAMPVVATRHSDIPYTFGPHADRLVPERDVGALVERLERYIDDPAALTREGLELRTQILGAFDTRICAGRLSDHYDSATHGVPA
jgi:colanic acid/amylovoran biosynthesis glycosyltransferase